jgi:hypothetical protein
VPVSHFDRLQPSLFRAVVDYLTLPTAADAKAKVSIDTIPPYALEVRIHPRNVDFIIEK